MKSTFICSILFCFITTANAQSPFAIYNTSLNKKGASKGLSADSYWLGAQVGYKFGKEGAFTDNLLVSAKLLYDIELSEEKQNFHLPVMGNISNLRDAVSKDSIAIRAKDLLLTNQGINVGVYPFYILRESDHHRLTLHGSAMYKLNSYRDKGEKDTFLDQGRFSVGLETTIGAHSAGKYPLVVSVAPTATIFNPNTYESVFGERKSSILTLEITGVVPLGAGFGLLLEGILGKKPSSVLRAGILISAKSSSKKDDE